VGGEELVKKLKTQCYLKSCKEYTLHRDATIRYLTFTFTLPCLKKLCIFISVRTSLNLHEF